MLPSTFPLRSIGVAYRILFVTACLLLPSTARLLSQSAYQVHSHNDYLQDVPFWYAYSSGANSIEADLWLRDGSLFVAHDRVEIDPKNTFSSLYLEPLNRLATEGRLRPLQLLIDLKSEAYETLDSVVATIERFPALVDSVTFVISGNRPKAEDYADYPAFIWFDHQNLSDLEEIDLDRVALVSQSFRSYSNWNGLGRMTAADFARVDSVIQLAREADKPVRFWATPDTKTAWSAFAQMGVDYVNTDEPAAARSFLDRLDANTFAVDRPTATYAPRNEFDGTTPPRKIILMIGDGNGLAQISAARMANGGALSLTNIPTVGLVSTASADDAVTDSAAGATAMATGVKTNNRAIGVDPAGQPVPNLVEILSAEGYRTGIITTDDIAGATPSAFFAHTDERDDAETITNDLVSSNLSFFIAGGESRSGAIAERFTPTSLDALQLGRPAAVYNGAGKMPSVRGGREDFLSESLSRALSLLKEDSSFFLLVEGAQIDNGGHTNDIATVVTEGLDFDRAVAQALRFADTDGETLVIITADHETGGMDVAGGARSGAVRADFLTTDHSGSLVPLFAYGPGASAFAGVFENTDLFVRILAALQIEK